MPSGAAISLAGTQQREQGRQSGGSQDQPRDQVTMKVHGGDAAHDKKSCPENGWDQRYAARCKRGCPVSQEKNQCLNLGTAPYDGGPVPAAHTSSPYLSHAPSPQPQVFTAALCPTCT